MCNDFGNRVPYSAYVEEFSQLGLPLLLPTAAPNLEPRDDIWSVEVAPVIRRHGNGVELARLRSGLAPGRPKAPPVINFRSEGRRFPTGRCFVPASHVFEFTGERSPKSKWRLTKAGEDWFCLAGPWRPATADTPEAFTLLTTSSGPDVASIHGRHVIVLDRADWIGRLDHGRPEKELLRPSPAGSLLVEQVR